MLTDEGKSLIMGHFHNKWVPPTSGDPLKGTTCSRTSRSLRVCSGLFDMRVVSMANDSRRVTEVATGRTCVNCDGHSYEFIIIPTKTAIEILCVPCMQRILGAASEVGWVDPSEAIEGMQKILAETSG